MGWGSMFSLIPERHSRSTFNEVIDEVDISLRSIFSNHCPNHPYVSLVPLNATAQDGVAASMIIPAQPMYEPGMSVSVANISDKIGVLFDGSILRSPYAGPEYGMADRNNRNTWAPAVQGREYDFVSTPHRTTPHHTIPHTPHPALSSAPHITALLPEPTCESH
eukprot:2136980-Pyramimonas_sp.AAC.1